MNITIPLITGTVTYHMVLTVLEVGLFVIGATASGLIAGLGIRRL